MTHRRRRILMLLLAMVVLAGCNSTHVGKTGAHAKSPVTLRMVLPEAG